MSGTHISDAIATRHWRETHLAISTLQNAAKVYKRVFTIQKKTFAETPRNAAFLDDKREFLEC